jgi:ATP-dependent Clp protease ATP-binding subunit ClpA
MFERYTEKARRVIFFARYEASQFGSRTIESEHFLLGLLREDNNLVKRFVPDWPAIEHIRAEITKRVSIGEKVSTSVDLPLSQECKRILSYAAEEAELLRHGSISTEHLLLGMLRETNSLGAEILRAHGLNPDPIREKIALLPMPQDEGKAHLPEAGCVPDPETAMRIAEAVWIPLYGEDLVKQQRPLQADLTASVWTVRGSPPPAQAAEPLVIVMSRVDGRIFKIGGSVSDAKSW